MLRFAQLYEAIQSTRSTKAKVEAMAAYFAEVPEADAAVAVFLLSGRRLKRMLGHAQLKQLIIRRTGLPDWLISACHQHVGDFAEMVQLLNEDTRQPHHTPLPLHLYYQEIADWNSLLDIERLHQANRWLDQHNGLPLMLLLKLLTGGMRAGVSEKLVIQALAEWTRQPVEAIGQRMLGNWEPSPAFIQKLKQAEKLHTETGPRPFCLAAPLEQKPEALGNLSDFLFEWKWDGIRAQLIHQSEGSQLWSRGQEFVTPQFPEIMQAALKLPEPCILDGELLAWNDKAPRPFAALQKRLNRKRLTAAMLNEVKVIFMVYDALQIAQEDLRPLPLWQRRKRLEQLLGNTGNPIHLSQTLMPANWQAVAQLREQALQHHAEGLMIKQQTAPYTAGRKRGVWWKWKVDPYTADCVLIGAELGSGRRATLYTDYTFAIRNTDGTLVPIAKAYSGLSDQEIRQLDTWIRKHSTGKHGRMRSVEAEQVFELGFEGIARSSRHKSGLALRFPRILRWRRDKPASEIERLETLQAMIENQSQNQTDNLNPKQLELLL